jgi:MSHA biogenesis protein MshI
MAISLNAFGFGAKDWTGVDVSAEGRMLAVKVRPSRTGRPLVLRCAESSAVATGEHALGELAQAIGPGRWNMPLARGDYQMMVMPEPPVPEKEMEASLRWSLASVIDFPVDDAVIAWMRIPTAEFQPKAEKQLYVIAARRSLVDEQAGMFLSAKLPLEAIDVRETALRNIAALIGDRNQGLGLLTVGGSGVTTTFTYRGELYLDRFIAQRLDEVVQGDETRLQRFFDRIAQQVQQSMDVLARTYPFIDVSRIVVAPAPGLDLVEALKGRLRLLVQPLDLAEVLDVSAVPQLRRPDVQARYLFAVGAALRGLKGAGA